MKRYSLPLDAVPGTIPTAVLAHRDYHMTGALMSLHCVAALDGDRGPFTAEQLHEKATSTAADRQTLSDLENSLERLAEAGFVDVQYMV